MVNLVGLVLGHPHEDDARRWLLDRLDSVAAKAAILQHPLPFRPMLERAVNSARHYQVDMANLKYVASPWDNNFIGHHAWDFLDFENRPRHMPPLGEKTGPTPGLELTSSWTIDRQGSSKNVEYTPTVDPPLGVPHVGPGSGPSSNDDLP